MIFAVAIFLWIVVAGVTGLLVRFLCVGVSLRPWQWVLMLACLVPLLALYCRPHHDILAGQDGPAYLHCAVEYDRHGCLSYEDEMLGSMDASERAGVLYRGHKSSYLTKFGSLLLPDIEHAQLQTWFQSAPSVLLSVIAGAFGSYGVLLVLPLFGLLNGLALAALSTAVFGRSRGVAWTAMLLYWLNPLVIWHARALRPELIASFFLWSGIAILFRSMKERDGRVWGWLLGSLAVNIAPFFHVTTTMVVAPFSLVMVWYVCKCSRKGLIFGAVQSVMVALFALQSFSITDPYGLSRYFSPTWVQLDWWHWGLFGCVGWSLVLGLSFVVRRFHLKRCKWMPPTSYLRGIAAVVVCVLLGALYRHSALASTSELKSFVYHYYYRTDLSAVVGLISLPIAMGCLAGLLMMLLSGGRLVALRYALCFVALPAALGVGNMYDFFTTRYLLVAFIPLLTLCLGFLVQSVRFFPKLRVGVLLVLILCLVQGRMLLVRHVEYEGLYEALESAADEVNVHNGVVLCESSRIAGALEHLFGVSTLGVENERASSYDPIMKTWLSLMEKWPEREFYYMTPFDSVPHHAGVSFEFVRTIKLKSSVLVDRRRGLPVETKPWRLSLNIYCMQRGDHEPENGLFNMSPGNMGYSRFSGCRYKSGVTVQGFSISELLPLHLQSTPNLLPSDLWIVAYDKIQEREQPRIFLKKDGVVQRVDSVSLGNHWHLIRVSAFDLELQLERPTPKRVRDESTTNNQRPTPNEEEAGLELWSEEGVVFTDAFRVSDEGVVEDNDVFSRYAAVEVEVALFVARWSRQNAGVSLPSTGDRGAVLLSFMTPPEEAKRPVEVVVERGDFRETRLLDSGCWRWSAISVPRNMAAGEIILRTDFRFNPKVSRMHDDLALFVGQGALIQR